VICAAPYSSAHPCPQIIRGLFSGTLLSTSNNH
jgi:hypothetical protein